jgi:DNA-binding response OmpR family regulator
MSYKVLLVEDDQSIGSLIEAVFNGNGAQISWFSSGIEAIDNFRKGQFDICILDFSLPDMDGFTLSTQIKAIDDVPFLFVTANHETQVKYQAFENGCDDFILKPFQVRELVLRVEAIIRRFKKNDTIVDLNNLLPPDFNFDYNARLISYENKAIKLSGKESHLMKLMLDHINQVVTRKKLMEEVWGTTDNYTSKCLDVYLSKLRKIIKEFTPLEILNEHGVGFKIISLKNA